MTDEANTPSRSRIDIRPGTVDDVVELDRLLRLLAQSLGDLDDHQSTADSLRRDGFIRRRLFSTFLAWPKAEGTADGDSESDGGEAVGACVYLPDYSTSRGRSGVYILDLVVAAKWQGQGVGLDLLRAAADAGRRQWNADYLLLSVDKANDGAQRFYRRHGLLVDKKSKVMTLEGIDSLLER